jgi:hypothetical protein
MSADLNSSAATAPTFALLVMCVECGAGVEVLLPTDRSAIALLLAQRGWYMSVLTPQGQGLEVSLVVGAVCASCAPIVYSPELLTIAEERRQKLLADRSEGPR